MDSKYSLNLTSCVLRRFLWALCFYKYLFLLILNMIRHTINITFEVSGIQQIFKNLPCYMVL